MGHVLADRVLETSSTAGTGPYTLDGAVTGFRTVASVALSGDTFYYFAEDVGAYGALSGGWEVGIGTAGANGVMARTAVHASSNNNAAVAWAEGTRRIGIGLSANQYTGLSIPVMNAATRLIQTQKTIARMALRGQAL